jgi:hypothetical protein
VGIATQLTIRGTACAKASSPRDCGASRAELQLLIGEPESSLRGGGKQQISQIS